ncbi:MAG: hypothetical protein R3C10_18415 [Pirellulales bacterium]
MMRWRESVRAHAESRGRKVYESALGIGIEFQDKSDAFWLLPGEPMSSVDFSLSVPIDVDAYLTQYDRINDLRHQTLHVLMHHLAEQRTCVTPCASGIWYFDAGLLSGEIWAGEDLTRAAAKSESVAETIRNWQGAHWGGKPPSERRMQRYLETEGLPAAPIVEEVEFDKQSISQALVWMGFCKVLGTPESWSDTEKLQDAIEPRGRIGRALQQLAQRLPHCTASCDLMKPGTLCIEYSDGYGTFDIDARSRNLARRFRSQTPEDVGNALADEYARVDATRTQLFTAVWHAASEMDWSVDRIGLAFFGIASKVMLGKKTREVEFRVDDELTELIRERATEDVLRELFSAHEEFLDKCLSALRHPTTTISESDLPTASLPPLAATRRAAFDR